MAECVDKEWTFSMETPHSSWEVGGETQMHFDLGAAVDVDIEQLQFLCQGPLHLTEEKVDSVYETSPSPTNGATGKAAHMKLVNRLSDTSLRGSWKNRWCVLSQTHDGVQLVYYKHKMSFSKCEPPMGVVFMDNCHALHTIADHSKSPNTFSLSFPGRNILLYPETQEELQQWLTVFQTSLNLHDASIQSPLKGLPKQKAERKDSSSSPHPLKQEPPSCFHGNTKRAPKEMEIEEPNQRSKVKGLSYRTLSTEEVDSNTVKRVSGAKTKQPVVSELDSEKSPIQLLGFRSLNM